MKSLLWPRTHMNLESLWIGQNLSCRCTAGKTGLVCWKAPGAGFNSVELTTGWLGPSLMMAGPCGALAPPCTKFGLAGEKFGRSALGLLSGRLGLTCCTLGFTA